jgi:AraC-like DNA-binding protein
MFLTAPPPADLAPGVRLFWAAERTACPGTAERVVPDGCCELIVNVGAPHRVVDGSRDPVPQPRAFLFGQLRRAIAIAPTGWTSMVAVRFAPAGVGLLFGFDVRALDGRAVPIEDLFGRAAATLVERIQSAPTVPARWNLLAGFLRGATRRRPQPGFDAVEAATRQLCRTGARVDAVAREIGSSVRTLERRVGAGVGLAPRQLIRIARVDRAARLLRECSPRLVDVAHTAGFADQAHLTRDFARIVGLTPGGYVRELRTGVELVVP